MKTMKCAVRMMAKDNVAFEMETEKMIASIIDGRANELKAISKEMAKRDKTLEIEARDNKLKSLFAEMHARCDSRRKAVEVRFSNSKLICEMDTPCVGSVVTTPIVVMAKDMAVPCDLMMSRFEERMDAHDAVMAIRKDCRSSMIKMVTLTGCVLSLLLVVYLLL